MDLYYVIPIRVNEGGNGLGWVGLTISVWLSNNKSETNSIDLLFLVSLAEV